MVLVGWKLGGANREGGSTEALDMNRDKEQQLAYGVNVEHVFLESGFLDLGFLDVDFRNECARDNLCLFLSSQSESWSSLSETAPAMI